MNTHDLIREGDAARLMDCMKMSLLFSKNFKKHKKINMLTQCCCFFVKYLQFCMKGKLSIFAGITFLTKKGKNIPLDLKVEFYNHILKSCLRMLGENINAKSC